MKTTYFPSCEKMTRSLRKGEQLSSRKAVHGGRIEHELLLACAGVKVGYETVEEIRVYLGENTDWEYVIRTAIRHGVTPLLTCILICMTMRKNYADFV